MTSLFSKPDPKKMLHEQKRELTKIERELERDRAQLAKQEQMLIMEIKKAAKSGNEAAAKNLAKQLVRVRKQKEKSLNVSTQVKGIGIKTTSMQSNIAMSKAMTGATKVMATANKQMNVPQMQKTMMEFEKQNMQMDMSEELMNDTIDSVMDDEMDEEEGQNIMNQVLDEIGIDVSSKLSSVPASKASSSLAIDEDADVALEARMAKLRS